MVIVRINRRGAAWIMDWFDPVSLRRYEATYHTRAEAVAAKAALLREHCS